MKKKITAIILSATIIISMFALPVYASETVTDPATQKVYSVLDDIVNALVKGISNLIMTPNWAQKKDYKTENFYSGYTKDEYKTSASADDKWSIGYSNASITTGKELSGEGDYYVGGSLSVTKKLATEQWDDQLVRTVAISDGRGISIFAVIDAYGLANTDVRAIRNEFQKYADENGLDITTVNISVLHQHSCVDTFGMNGDIVGALFLSSFRTVFNLGLPSGQNKEYMDNLYNVVIDSMKNAINNMETGDLYYGSVDVKDYIRDKRDPQVFDSELHRFRFVPDNDESKETWIVNGAIHCVGNGASHQELTGDYPYYMEQYINENDNANFFYIQGAELAITSKGDSLELDEEKLEAEGSKYEIKVYGETLAKKLESITDEEAVAPIFNITMKEMWLDIDNNILLLAAKGGLLVNNIHKNGFNKYAIVTEIGYCEFGENIAVSIIPGELAPEIAFGDADSSSTSWQGKDWEYPSFESLADGKEFIVFGLTNDQVGYLLTSNNWHSIFTENEEIVSVGQYGGAQVTEEYISLYKEIKG